MEAIIGLFMLFIVGIFIFSFVAAIVVLVQNSRLKQRMTDVENKLAKLQSIPTKPQEIIQPEPKEQPIQQEPTVQEPEPVTDLSPEIQKQEPPEQPPIQPTQPITPPAKDVPIPAKQVSQQIFDYLTEQTLEQITEPAPEPEPVKEEIPVPIEVENEPEPMSTAYRVHEPTPKVQKKVKEKSELWVRFERQLIDNWTGILGSIIITMGAIFLAILAALEMPPFYRFVMLTGFSTALFVIYFILRAKEKWLKLGVWLRSSGCAIFLFACLGSGGIPGLKWIDSPLFALALLLVGVGINIIVGTLSGSQFFASFHSVLSLVALAIAPQGQITLTIAVAVTLLQIILTYRNRWEYHLLLTITSFLIYHLYWVYDVGILAKSHMPTDLRFTGIGAVAVIGIATAFVHYRKIYGDKTFETLPFLVHLFNWFYMGIGFYMYSTGSKWNTIVLAVAALAAFILSRRAKKLGIRWLFVTDTLIAQAIALVAVFTLSRWALNSIPITTILMLEVIIFLALMIMEEEKVLQWFGIFFFHTAGLVLIFAAFGAAHAREEGEFLPDTIVTVIAMIVYTIFHLFLVRKKTETFDSLRNYGMGEISDKFSLSGIIAGLLGVPLFFMVFDFQWAPYAAALIISTLLLLRRKFQLKGLAAGTYVLTMLVFVIGWVHIPMHLRDKAVEAAIYGLPFLIIALVGMRMSYVEKICSYRKFPWIYLFSIHLAIYSWAALNPVSPLAPGTLWLLLVPVYMEAAQWLSRRYGDRIEEKGKTHRFLYHWGYIFMGLFIIRHLVVHIQSNLHIGNFSIRLLQELLALAIFIYWAMAKPVEDKTGRKPLTSWKILHPLMWELAIVFGVMTIFQEVHDIWYPVAWILSAFLLLILGNAGKKHISRFRFYSVLFYWVTAFYIAFISTMDAAPAKFFTQEAWFGGFVALLLQVGFVVFFYTKGNLDTVELPAPVAFIKRWIASVARRPHPWIYYPFFLAVGLFLYWTFDRSLLTLLWMVEVFAIFTLSLLLRESHFRYTANAGLVACVIRLIVYDMARSSTINRAFVFLGVGVMMIGINVLYNKFRDRFKENTD